ncbi:MAG TPA: ribonuclease III [Xanthomonadales bacterium]|nr:ribonuclease III [Xanthomonadales bacterium]
MTHQIPGINYQFSDPGLLEKALTHRSVGSGNYERLEFLGDSVLDLVIAERLIVLHPKATEGDLSRMRSRLVRADSLRKVASSLDLGKHLRLGIGERKSGGRRRASILGDALEAVIGAIYMDGGYRACQSVILEIFQPSIEDLPDAESLKDPKTRLQEYLQGRGRPLPRYELQEERGADHDKEFSVRCSLRDTEQHAIATGTSRRKAEQAAAQYLYEQLVND